jgi:hypothetical protein
MKYVEIVWDVIFSFEMVIFVLLASACSILAFAVIADSEQHNIRKAEISHCYSLNQIHVDTDAGSRCVSPENLTVIK